MAANEWRDLVFAPRRTTDEKNWDEQNLDEKNSDEKFGGKKIGGKARGQGTAAAEARHG